MAKTTARKALGTAPRSRRGLLDITNGMTTPLATPKGSVSGKGKLSARFSKDSKGASGKADADGLVTPVDARDGGTPVATPTAKPPATRRAIRIGGRLTLISMRGHPHLPAGMALQLLYPTSHKVTEMRLTSASMKDISNMPGSLRGVVLEHMTKARISASASPRTARKDLFGSALRKTSTPHYARPTASSSAAGKAVVNTPSSVASSGTETGRGSSATASPSSRTESASAGSRSSAKSKRSPTSRESPRLRREYADDRHAPRYSEAEMQVVRKRMEAHITAELDARHLANTEFLLSENSRVQDMYDGAIAEMAAMRAKFAEELAAKDAETDAIISQFEATSEAGLSEKDAELARLTEELRVQRITMTATQTTLVQAVSDRDAAKAAVEDLQTQLKEQEAASFDSLTASAEEISKLSKEVARFQEEQRGWEKERAALQKEVSREKAKVELAVDAAKKQLGAARETYEGVAAKERKALEANKELRRAFKDLQAKAADIQTKGKKAAAENARLSERIASLEKSLAAKTARIREHEVTIAGHAQAAAEARKQEQAATATANKVSSELRALKESLEQKRNDLAEEYESKATAFKSEIYDLKKAVEDLQADAADHREAEARLQEQLAESVAARDAAEAKRAELETISNELLAMLETKQ